MCLSCFLRDEPTALICQILLFLAAGAPFRCHRQNHHPSPRSTAPPRFRVRGPSFDALDRAHLKARRHSASSLSGTAAHRHAPGHEDARFCTNVWGRGGIEPATPRTRSGFHTTMPADLVLVSRIDNKYIHTYQWLHIWHVSYEFDKPVGTRRRRKKNCVEPMRSFYGRSLDLGGGTLLPCTYVANGGS